LTVLQSEPGQKTRHWRTL